MLLPMLTHLSNHHQHSALHRNMSHRLRGQFNSSISQYSRLLLMSKFSRTRTIVIVQSTIEIKLRLHATKTNISRWSDLSHSSMTFSRSLRWSNLKCQSTVQMSCRRILIHSELAAHHVFNVLQTIAFQSGERLVLKVITT